MDSSSDEEFFDCQSEAIKYYAVACIKDKGKGIVTIDMNEARSKVKNSKGSRFSSFYDPLEAKRFAETPLPEEIDPTTKKKSVSQKKVSDPFPNASPRDLNALKSAIETGSLDKVKQLVWNNPRHLVTESDSPTLLQNRFRHNALHVAVSFHQAEIAAFVLGRLSNEEFWQSIYPTADDKCNRYRMQRVLDMYLNAPEVGNMETPLHLAAKFGSKECLRVILGQELTDTQLYNKVGLRADEIVCVRYTEEMRKTERTVEMQAIFNEKYVVLVAGDSNDGCQVLDPMTHCQLLRLLRQRNDGFRLDGESRPDSATDAAMTAVSGLGGVVRAYIGPMEQTRAHQLRCRWAVLNAQDAPTFEELRRRDAEKGMECHGRYLAGLVGAPWRELWRFLDDGGGSYTDLAADDGLGKLEEHLGRIEDLSCLAQSRHDYHDNSDVASPPEDSGTPTGTPPHQLHHDQSQTSHSSNGTFQSAYGSLVRLFSRLTIQSPSTARQALLSTVAMTTPIKTHQSIFRVPDGLVTSTPLRQAPSKIQASLRISRTPFNSSVIGDGVLTPTDRQVRRAVLSGSQGHHLRYPRVTKWLHNMSEIDPVLEDSITAAPSGLLQSLSSFVPPNGFLSMSTPVKNHPQSSRRPPHTTQPHFSKCLSPLSRIELED